MVWFCMCAKIREKIVPEEPKRMDFRKADPTYVNFKPNTAGSAIDKFYRHKNLGVPPHLWPEVFVNCAANLPDAELQKFQDWLVNPQGKPTGTMLGPDKQNQDLRKQLLKEAEARDRPPIILESYMDVDDEKEPQPVEDPLPPMEQLSVGPPDEFEMVSASSR